MLFLSPLPAGLRRPPIRAKDSGKRGGDKKKHEKTNKQDNESTIAAAAAAVMKINKLNKKQSRLTIGITICL